VRFKSVGLLTLFASLGLAQAASAADLPRQMPAKAPAYISPVYNWSGFYFGGHIGGAWSSTDVTDTGGFLGPVGSTFNLDNSGFAGGGQVGFNWQWANWVLGVQADITAMDLHDRMIDPFFSTTAIRYRTDGVTTVTGRLGYAWNNVLLYGKGGVAWAHDKYSFVDPTVPASFNGHDTRSGYVVGGGLEYGFAPSWSAFVEYDFVGLDSRSVSLRDPVLGTTSASAKQDIQMVKVGLNFRLPVPHY